MSIAVYAIDSQARTIEFFDDAESNLATDYRDELLEDFEDVGYTLIEHVNADAAAAVWDAVGN